MYLLNIQIINHHHRRVAIMSHDSLRLVAVKTRLHLTGVIPIRVSIFVWHHFCDFSKSLVNFLSRYWFCINWQRFVNTYLSFFLGYWANFKTICQIFCAVNHHLVALVPLRARGMCAFFVYFSLVPISKHVHKQLLWYCANFKAIRQIFCAANDHLVTLVP